MIVCGLCIVVGGLVLGYIYLLDILLMLCDLVGIDVFEMVDGKSF